MSSWCKSINTSSGKATHIIHIHMCFLSNTNNRWTEPFVTLAHVLISFVSLLFRHATLLRCFLEPNAVFVCFTLFSSAKISTPDQVTISCRYLVNTNVLFYSIYDNFMIFVQCVSLEKLLCLHRKKSFSLRTYLCSWQCKYLCCSEKVSLRTSANNRAIFLLAHERNTFVCMFQ